MSEQPGPQWRGALPVGRALLLVVLAVTALAVAAPAHRLAVGLAVIVGVAGTAYGVRFGPEEWRQRLTGLAGLASAGIALAVIDPAEPGWLAAGVAIAAGLVRLPPRPAVIFAGCVAVLFAAAPLRRGDTAAVPVQALICAGFVILGMVLAAVRARAVHAERLLESVQAARASAAEAERYAERQRLAREIHDILAHTLSAQAVQLEGARLLLAHGGTADDVRQRIETAQRLARDGLEETRRAVLSLRGERAPLPETLRALAGTAGATYYQEGEPGPLPAPAALAFERTVQEGLTNARKHAPGATVTVTMRFQADHDEVEIRDSGAAGPVGAVPAGGTVSGGGYGLAGMRERAALIGGELVTESVATGAEGRGFRVWLTVPRSAPSGS
jgi:signal transduction histidine kinase